MSNEIPTSEDITDKHQQGASSSGDSAADTTTNAGSDQLQALEAEVASLTEALQTEKETGLRALAEVQNVRRRAEQDVEKAHKFGLEKFVGDMLVVADNLERAIVSAGELGGDYNAVLEGVELTLKSLLDGLKKHNVVQIDPTNEPFDPQFHQAMTAIENGEVEPNTVLDVFQKGYTLNGRLVRPAMVVVAKAPGA